MVLDERLAGPHRRVCILTSVILVLASAAIRIYAASADEDPSMSSDSSLLLLHSQWTFNPSFPTQLSHRTSRAHHLPLLCEPYGELNMGGRLHGGILGNHGWV